MAQEEAAGNRKYLMLTKTNDAITLDHTRLKYSCGLQEFVDKKDAGGPIFFPHSKICRLYVTHKCSFGDKCRQIHMARSLYKELLKQNAFDVAPGANKGKKKNKKGKKKSRKDTGDSTLTVETPATPATEQRGSLVVKLIPTTMQSLTLTAADSEPSTPRNVWTPLSTPMTTPTHNGLRSRSDSGSGYTSSGSEGSISSAMTSRSMPFLESTSSLNFSFNAQPTTAPQGVTLRQAMEELRQLALTSHIPMATAISRGFDMCMTHSNEDVVSYYADMLTGLSTCCDKELISRLVLEECMLRIVDEVPLGYEVATSTSVSSVILIGRLYVLAVVTDVHLFTLLHALRHWCCGMAYFAQDGPAPYSAKGDIPIGVFVFLLCRLLATTGLVLQRKFPDGARVWVDDILALALMAITNEPNGNAARTACKLAAQIDKLCQLGWKPLIANSCDDDGVMRPSGLCDMDAKFAFSRLLGLY